ncbi:ribosome hibernation-promoting factor, HPF/YfiA family [Wenzhouxiangella limi]|uniref:Ribosome hibernation promoting factor n=1 Tax=Wenzhouxiangella limi TaxID=2707351 RepID=A0A845V4J4_9GAMM|nr:ribosome-associated translation inhibitor RaiA [Wenzhouxiangella limi]NDY96106.1 ribosome-associated translation inhibitor RaiA [Wenzhouxiangella limi]
MQLEVTGQNIDVTQALRAYIQEKTERLERHYDNLISGHFVLRLEKLEHTVEGTVQVAGKTNALHAVAVAEDMYAAIDGLIDKLDRQVRRHKSRVTDHRNSA